MTETHGVSTFNYFILTDFKAYSQLPFATCKLDTKDLILFFGVLSLCVKDMAKTNSVATLLVSQPVYFVWYDPLL